MDDTGTAEHSQQVRAIYDAVAALPRGWITARRLGLHGFDIGGTEDFLDEGRQAHGDVINLTVAFTSL